MIEELSDKQKLEMYTVYFKEMKNLHIGQGLDLYWHSQKDLEEITKEKYIYMAIQKTGGLFRMGINILAIVNNWDDDFKEFF